MNQISVDQTRKQYVDEGSGEVIILLYGLFGSVKNFEPLIQHLKKTYRVIVPVFPFFDMGFPVDILSLKQFLYELTEELGLEKCHLLGNSMGGHIALLYTLAYPHKVESLILSGSSGLFENGMGDSFPRVKDYNYIKSKTELTFYNPCTASKELIDEIYEIVNSRKAFYILALAKSAIRSNLKKDLPRIQVPCCLIWGRNDTITPLPVAVEFNRLIPGSRLYLIDKCGHVPMLETPAKFNALLDFFMKSLRKRG